LRYCYEITAQWQYRWLSKYLIFHLTVKNIHLEDVSMSAPIAARPAAKRKEDPRKVGTAAFWRFSFGRDSLKDSERIQQIKVGFPALLVQAFRVTFDLQDRNVETLLNASISTLERRRREQKNLDPVASERLDRIATVSHLAEEVFESQERAAHWMSTPNKALGGSAPIMLCETEIGAKQVRRVLQALEWGGSA
jgi:putative toxin-antitoxin system antitoxin component (TIGR02293 family)